MTRDELESLIWLNAASLTEGPAACRVEAMDRILSAADAYTATTLGEIDGYRRLIPRSHHQPVSVHFQRPGTGLPVCFGRPTRSPVTSEPADVTCSTCKRSGPYRAALAVAS